MALEKEEISKIEDNIAKSQREYLLVEREYRQRKQQRKFIFLLGSAFVYTIFAASLLYSFRSVPLLLIWPFRVNDTTNINARLDQIEKNIGALRNSMATSTAKTNPSSNLNGEIIKIKQRQTALEETLTLDPEKAVTAVLLRDKQKTLEDRMTELQNSQIRLEGKVDNFVTTVVLAPIAAAILAFLGWLIQKRYKKSGE